MQRFFRYAMGLAFAWGINMPALAAVHYDVSVVGDFRFLSGQPSKPDYDRLAIDEIELALQGNLSPWSRADVFMGISKTGMDVEEAYFTFMSLPGEIQARIGKFKLPFGKLNPIHPEGWSFVDSPLAIRRLLGEEGWNDHGIQVTGFVPNPYDRPITATVNLVNGDKAPFRSTTASLRLTDYLEIDEQSGIELGVSSAHPFRKPGTLLGLDARYRWRPDPSRSFTLIGEYLQHFQPGIAPSGAYLSADTQWMTAHNLDLRVDRAYAQNGLEHAISLTYGYTVWENTRFKLQGTHAFTPFPEDRILFQTVFVLGPHKHALNF